MIEKTWISVNERYPGDGEDVEVMYSDGSKAFGFYVEPPMGGWFLDITQDFIEGKEGHALGVVKWRSLKRD